MKTRESLEEQKTIFEAERKKLEAEKTAIKRKTDEEIKENRLEMEGKLEKMKEKMVSARDIHQDKLECKNQTFSSLIFITF
jgi:hypothetical protein